MSTTRSHQSRLLLYAVVCALALVIGWTTAEPAGACHGNGVSRVCEISYPTLRLESVSYDNPFDPYAWIYTQSWYYSNYSQFLYGDNTCIDDWSCDHGIYRNGLAGWYQVAGGHRFNHDGQTYSLPNSWTDGQCFPSESGGC